MLASLFVNHLKSLLKKIMTSKIKIFRGILIKVLINKLVVQQNSEFRHINFNPVTRRRASEAHSKKIKFFPLSMED